jgi:hypothetical protein
VQSAVLTDAFENLGDLSMSRSRWLITVSVAVATLLVLALMFTCVLGKPLPFMFLFFLTIATIATCAYAITVANRFLSIADRHPDVEVGARGSLRSLLSAGQAFGVLLFLLMTGHALHSACGATLNPSTWCSVSIRPAGDQYLRSINGKPPTPVSREEYDALQAATQASIAGLCLFFALLALRIGISAADYERIGDADDQRPEHS